MRALEALLGLHAPWQLELIVRFAGASLVVLGATALVARFLVAGPEARSRLLAASMIAAVLVPVLASFLAVVRPAIPTPAAMARIDNPVVLTEGPRAELLRWLAGPRAETLTRAAAPPPSSPGPGPFAFVFLAWIAGTSLLAARLALGLRRLDRRAGAAPPVTDERIRRMLERLGAPEALRVIHSDVFGGPAVFGWRRPVLVLPSSVEEWDQHRLRTCLLHELAHVRRRDWLVGVLAQAVRAALWFNPLAWWITREMKLSAELACDRQVLLTGVRGVDYARDLLAAARDCIQPRKGAAPTLTLGDRVGLDRRVRQAIRSRPRRRSARTLGLAIVLLLFVSAATALVRPELAGCAEEHAFSGPKLLVY